jgi:drug/metabolite transporter (DMT)-like permease
MSVLGSVIAYNAFIWLLSKRSPVIVGTYAYVNPVIAVLLGAWLANEKLNRNHVFSLVAILIGVMLVNIPKYREVKILQNSDRLNRADAAQVGPDDK